MLIASVICFCDVHDVVPMKKQESAEQLCHTEHNADSWEHKVGKIKGIAAHLLELPISGGLRWPWTHGVTA